MDARDWLARLGKKLTERRGRIHRWQRYYDGDHDLPAGPGQHKDAYRAFQRKSRSNLCRLAVDSMVNRMHVIGYNAPGAEDRTNNEVWSLWQDAKLDSRQYDLYRQALTVGAGYVIVGSHPRKSGRPLVTIESARNVIIETDPADPTYRLAAMRLWHDDIEQKWRATVFLPGERHGFETAKEYNANSSIHDLKWRRQDWVKRYEPEISSEEVPVVEFANAALGVEPRSEFDVGLDIQDRMNLTLLNRLTAERYAAFRQRYLMNYEVEYDEETGLPISPFNPGSDQIFTIPPPRPGDPEPRLGDLVQTDTGNMLRAVDADMKAFAATTITPVYYLPGDLINISAEGIAALDAGHICKINERAASWSESWEEVLQLSAGVVGLDAELKSAEVVWARPENFDLSSMADYAIKFAQAGYPLPIIAERLGDSPQQIADLKREMSRAAFRASLQSDDTGDDTQQPTRQLRGPDPQ